MQMQIAVKGSYLHHRAERSCRLVVNPVSTTA